MVSWVTSPNLLQMLTIHHARRLSCLVCRPTFGMDDMMEDGRRLMNDGMEGGRGRRRSIEDEMEMMRCIDEYTDDALGGREIRARR